MWVQKNVKLFCATSVFFMDFITSIPNKLYYSLTPRLPRFSKPINPDDEPDALPVKFVFASTWLGYDTKVFTSDKSYNNFYAWLPKTDKQKQGVNIPLLYSQAFGYYADIFRKMYFYRGEEEPYLKIYKYIPSESVSDEMEEFCLVKRTKLQPPVFYYTMYFQDRPSHQLYFHTAIPIADFKVEEKRYRWVYYHERIGVVRTYYYSLYEAQPDEELMCDKLREGTGWVLNKWRRKASLSTHSGYEHYKLAHKIGEFTYCCSPGMLPTINFQKISKFNSFQQGLTQSIESIDHKNLTFLVTALILKTHQDFRRQQDDGNNDFERRPRPPQDFPHNR